MPLPLTRSQSDIDGDRAKQQSENAAQDQGACCQFRACFGGRDKGLKMLGASLARGSSVYVKTTVYCRAGIRFNRTMTIRKLLAYAAIYFFWGASFLAIRQVVAVTPPFFAASFRFLCAGAILYAYSRWKGMPQPSKRQWIGARLCLAWSCLPATMAAFSGRRRRFLPAWQR